MEGFGDAVAELANRLDCIPGISAVACPRVPAAAREPKTRSIFTAEHRRHANGSALRSHAARGPWTYAGARLQTAHPARLGSLPSKPTRRRIRYLLQCTRRTICFGVRRSLGVSVTTAAGILS